MKRYLSIVLLAALCPAQTPSVSGKWLDVSKDVEGHIFFGGTSNSDGHLLVAEDFEVVQTHEICASVTGYFMDKSQQGRYNVNFKGMRTSATFVFTTRYDAEHWVTRFCTPQSLTKIGSGHANLARNY